MKKKHLDVSSFAAQELFQSKRLGRSPGVPAQIRTSHGQQLLTQYTELVRSYDSLSESRPEPITAGMGIYVEITSVSGCTLPLDSLDNRDFKLCSCKKVDDKEVALIFIPEEKRGTFLKKLEQYLDPSKDGKPNKDGIRYPRNHNLIDSIYEIKLANIDSFWTDPIELFPTNRDVDVWWELWLKDNVVDKSAMEIANELAIRIDARLSNTSLSFFDSVVVLIRTSANKLEQASELIANLEELRKAKETPFLITESSP